MKQKIIRIGLHSLAVIIPAAFVRALGIKYGDTAQVFTRPEKGSILVHFQGAVQLPLPKAEKFYSGKSSRKSNTNNHAQ